MTDHEAPPVILCATTRLARNLRMTLQRQQRQSGASQWQSPGIFTLADWLNGVIEAAILLGEMDASSAPVGILTPTQENLLWEQSIQQSLKNHAASDLFDTSGLADAAMEANRLLTEWRLPIDAAQVTEETRQFMHWRADFQQRCRAYSALETVRYEEWQIACLERGAGRLPSHVQLAGFDSLHPHLLRLIAVLENRGITVSTYQLTLPTPQHCSHVELPDQDAECRAAVAWAAQQCQQNPDVKLAIVAPELESLRAKLADLLDDAFHPESADPAHAEILRCYDFTLGVSLLSLPIIRTALDLLRFAWQKQPLLQTEIAQLLHSVYWSASLQESDARAQLDARMRQTCALSLSNHRFLGFLEYTCTGKQILPLPCLLADTRALMEVAQKHNRLTGPSQWATVFKTALERTHWQGERSVSSHEFQAVTAFNKALEQLSNLAPFMGNISANEAIKRLSQLCKNQIFQAERKTAPSIQIMGMLEACAEPLDGLWVMGMNDHLWPPLARHNALLPAEIQRAAKTPNASSEVQTNFALTIHQRLIKSATQVTFSNALKDGERELRKSPLMQDLTELSAPSRLSLTLAESMAQTAKRDWQRLDDYQAPPIMAGEHVSGGTGLLKAQAICPAWAFYQYRLHARKLGEPVNGLDVMARGSLVHAVLAKFWSSHNQAALEAATDKLKMTLFAIAETELAEFNTQHNHALSPLFLSLEASRLSNLALAWLTAVEMQRPQNFDILACEQKYEMDIEGIGIRLVIDRIDQLADGHLLVIDYKTGSKLDYKNWAQAKITEPQLPIYAAFALQSADHEIGAVCYAKVRTADNAFVGVAATDGLVQGALVFDSKQGRKVFDEANFPDWHSVIRHWRNSISATAISIKHGDAMVTFENEKQLDYCDVTPLLRLPERRLQYEHQPMKGKA